MKLQVMLAVNDHKNGLHMGEVDCIEVEDILVIEGPPVSCSSNGYKLELLDGQYYNLKGYQTWVGNWCWDCAWLESIHVAKMVNHLLENKRWEYFEAEESLFNSPFKVTVQRLEALARKE